jgi:hypothetical protein
MIAAIVLTVLVSVLAPPDDPIVCNRAIIGVSGECFSCFERCGNNEGDTYRLVPCDAYELSVLAFLRETECPMDPPEFPERPKKEGERI